MAESESGSAGSTGSAVPLAPIQSDVWELDFYSRPVVGLDGKKLWELIIVDTSGTFEYVDPVPNSQVNSRELRKRVEDALQVSAKPPRTIKFFRSQMMNMITIALSDISASLNIAVVPTRKTYVLYKTLRQRVTNVYPSMPGFKASLLPSKAAAPGLLSIDSFGFSMGKRLPDALRCEKFAFGNFPLIDIVEFFKTADKSTFFGESYPADSIADLDLPDATLVPGIIAFSKRAPALAGWINGIDLAYINVMLQQRVVTFECGLNNSYQFAKIKDDIKEECKQFQALKQDSAGLHFFAIQESPDAEEVDGMWLLSTETM